MDKNEMDSFGVDYDPLPEAESYYPTRLEYLFGKAMQGLVTGRSERDLKSVVRNSMNLAFEAEIALDKAQD